MTETSEIKIEGYAPPEQAGGYLHLPFEVLPGTLRLDVSYTYDSQIGAEQGLTGGNTVDIGLFDQRGKDFNSAGFRGWSGSDLNGFFVASDDATPGYLRGPNRFLANFPATGSGISGRKDPETEAVKVGAALT